MLRVASGLAEDDTTRALDEVAALYGLMSRLDYLPSSPTLFNSGTRHPQMSSCYLLDSPKDELDSIYDRYHQVARLSKHAGGIGLAYSRIRARGSLIRGTNGHSNGIVPFLKTLDASVAAVNQGGRRKGAAAVYLETWHSDIEEFLELRDNTGEDARRTHNLNLAHWVPDEFMRRVNADAQWSLFSPSDVPELVDLWGEEFDAAYRAAEAKGLAKKTLPARELYGRMMRTLAQTGNGWMTFKDAANRTANQTAEPGHVVHSSNLCTEILEVTDDGETAVCNLGSVNLGAFVDTSTGDIDWERLDETVRTAVTFLDRVVDINFYPTEQAGRSNARWRPVGLGAMGLQDVFFKLRLPFDSPEAKALSTRIAERDHARRVRGLRRPRRAQRPAAGLGEDPYGQGRAAPRPLRRGADLAGALGGPARAHRRDRHAQLPAPRHRAHGHHRLHRGRVRVHRAAGVQPVQARDAVRRVPPGQLLPGGRAEAARRVGRPQPGGAARGERLGAGLRLDPRGRTGALPHGVGDPAARPDRHGGGPDPVPGPVPVPESLPGDADHRQALLDVRLRLEVGLKTTYYLRSRPATRIARAAPGHCPRAGHPGPRSGRLLPGEPRVLRGLPVMTDTTKNLLDPGFELTLRPMRYPDFYERYRDAIKNTWTVEEVDLHSDVSDLAKLSPAEQHLIGRLVAFFATGDSIVANNLVLTLYKHINSPEARLYLSRQLFEEAVHVQFYLTLLDTYLPDPEDRTAAFAAVENIPSIREKAGFCFKWMDSVDKLDRLESQADRRRFLLNLICFAACIEGLFFYGAFAYVYWFRSRGLLHGLATGTNWVFRDETMHMSFAFDVVDTVRKEEPELFDDELEQQVTDMLREAVEAELQFARDLCGDGLPGMNTESMRQYLECVADQRLTRLGFAPVYGSENPFSFMELQGVQELTNFFERRPSAYQVAVEGTVDLDEDF